MPNSDSFTVSWMPKCQEKIASLAQRAIALQKVQPLARFLKLIQKELKTHPRDWGDPIKNHHGMQAVEYARASVLDRFQVFYLVHNTAPVVFVKELILLECNPLLDS